MAPHLLKPAAGWAAAAVGSVLLAVAAPREQAVMGKLEPLAARAMDDRAVDLPQGLPAERTLVLVVFHPDQRHEARSWVDGMGLRDGTWPWLKVRVLQDPGDDRVRNQVKAGLQARPSREPARLVPVFTDPQAFARSLGLRGTEHAQLVVLDRSGNVLARAEGAFDEQKALALRETLLQD
jgi:hypothetical protein